EIDRTFDPKPVEMADPYEGPCAASSAPEDLPTPPGAGPSVPGDGEEDGETGDADGDGLEDDPVLNPACHYDPSCFVAESWGGPHIVTFDGVGYEFQSVAEFWFTRTTDEVLASNPTLEPVKVQMRTTKMTDRVAGALDWVSVTTGVAAEVGGKKVV